MFGTLSGAALAQSSVTLYGIIDMAVSRVNDGQSNLAYFSDWQVGRPGGWDMHSASSARLGLRGSEELGDGLKANFLIEHRLQPDSGTTEPRDGVTFSNGTRSYNAGFWNAQSYVGLSGHFGELRFGRTATPTFNVGLATDPWRYEYGPAGFAGFTRGGNFVAAAKNAINYLTPQIAGFIAHLSVGLGEGGASATGQGAPNGRNVGASLVYSEGPLWAALAYNDSKRPDGILNRTAILGLLYDFGPIKSIVNYSVGKNAIASNASTKTMLIGTHIPVGVGHVRAAVGRYDPAVGFNPNAVAPGATVATTPNPYAAYPVTQGQRSLKFAVGYVHHLSKRTSLSADVGTNKTETYTRSSGAQAGVKHMF